MSEAKRLAMVNEPWLRMTALVIALAALILIPFALWGDSMELATPDWMARNGKPLTIAGIGIALLIADVVLPVPSSLVTIALCWTLGPWWGGVATFAGLTLSFIVGYGLGRLLPESKLRNWVGAAAWDRMRTHAEARALWWIVIARPLPMLAEMTSILAGVWRVPFALAASLAALASALVAALYSVSVAWGLSEPGVLPMLTVLCLLPTVLWLIQRHIAGSSARAVANKEL